MVYTAHGLMVARALPAVVAGLMRCPADGYAPGLMPCPLIDAARWPARMLHTPCRMDAGR